jgi:hypothetical protein
MLSIEAMDHGASVAKDPSLWISRADAKKKVMSGSRLMADSFSIYFQTVISYIASYSDVVREPGCVALSSDLEARLS